MADSNEQMPNGVASGAALWHGRFASGPAEELLAHYRKAAAAGHADAAAAVARLEGAPAPAGPEATPEVTPEPKNKLVEFLDAIEAVRNATKKNRE